MMMAYDWVTSHSVTYLQVLFGVVLFLAFRHMLTKKPSVRRELQMDSDRKAVVRANVRDAYVNALYDMMRTKAITYNEYQREMLRLRKDMGFDVTWKINLHPSAIKAELVHLKEAIKERLPAEKVKVAVERAKAVKPKSNGKLNVPMKVQGA